MHITIQGFSGEVTCRAFSLTLKGVAKGLFRSLLQGSTDNFRELTLLFFTQIMASKIRMTLAGQGVPQGVCDIVQQRVHED